MLCHGFPGLWYSWRQQLNAIAEAGFRAVAMDMRGYGRSDRPSDVNDYHSDIIIADMLGLLAHFDAAEAIWVGHDFGAPLVHNIAVRHPDKARAVIGVACPYDFDYYGRGCAGSHPDPDAVYPRGFALPHIKPSQCSANIAQQHFIHLHYFNTPGPADRELGNNAKTFLQRIYWALSHQGRLLDWSQYPAEGTAYLDVLEEPPLALPWHWISEQDFDYMAQEYLALGTELAFIGGMNSYRIADANWETGAKWADAKIECDYLFIAGADDPVLQMIGPDAMDLMSQRIPNLRTIELIENAGHFVQLEQAEAFNTSLINFLQTLK